MHNRPVAFDEELAGRVREQLASKEGVTESAMFGGLAFLLDGNMVFAASGRGGLMVRVGAEAYEHALAEPHAAAVEMSGRPVRGWVLLDAADVSEPDRLRAWIERGLAFARTLAPKHRS